MHLTEEEMQVCFPFYKVLDAEMQVLTRETLQIRELKKGEMLFNADELWSGLKMIRKGQIRVFVATEHGGNATLFRVKEGEICIISLLCMSNEALRACIGIEAEKDSESLNIPTETYKMLFERCSEVRYMHDDLYKKRFGEITSVISDLLFSNIEQRLAKALLFHDQEQEGDEMKITHELLATDIGSAREVVTRNLKRFQNLGYLELGRAKIKILDRAALSNIQ